ncbi:DUF2268 domain-containing protein [Niallia sp. 03133]|uniref:DUF2268 domain-containing protein n=1 Tax=Niallia sp. 03133 TaxID=3458060 RepID=UPI004043B987
MEEDFSEPIKICKNFQSLFEDDHPRAIFRYLASYGMYRPSRQTKETFHFLVEKDVWKIVQKLYEKYKNKWHGPEINIYIFPFQPDRKGKENKSGVSFKDKLFLFVGEIEEDKEIEALFIHEYHHVCRMHYQKKKIEEYTLLDSIVMEGLAEHAVKKYCGKRYNASWCSLYQEEKIKEFWKEDLYENLDVKKNEHLHDVLLFGLGKYPHMMGYCSGYYLVNRFLKQKNFPEKTYFLLKSEIFANEIIV